MLLGVFCAVAFAALAEREYIWPEGKMPDAQDHQIAAMTDVLKRFGVDSEAEDDSFTVHGEGGRFSGGEFHAFDDHRIAMAIAVGATIADSPVEIDNPECAAKSYPGFFEAFARLRGM